MLSRFSPPSCHSSSTLVIIKMLGTTRWPKRRLRCYVGYRTLRFPALINRARNGWCSSTRERVAPAPVTIKCTGCAILSRGGNVLSSHQFDRVMMAFSDSPRDHAARPSVLRNRAEGLHQEVADSPNVARLLSESLPAPSNRRPKGNRARRRANLRGRHAKLDWQELLTTLTGLLSSSGIGSHDSDPRL
jgi:hypothetical protein